MTRARLALCFVLWFTGCSPGSSRVEVSGEVTYAGMPVPAGIVYLEPRSGSIGPQGIGDVVDGRFRTRSGWGAVAGPHTARVQFWLQRGSSTRPVAPNPDDGSGRSNVYQIDSETSVEIGSERSEPLRIDIPSSVVP